MGDPRKPKGKYSLPKKPWDKQRLDSEKEIVKEYGVVNKSEIYKMQSILKDFALRAKKLLSSTSPQAENDKKAFIAKLHAMSLIGANAQLDDVLALQLKNIMERRLQTLVLRKGFANTMKQARQFIVHQHIKVGNKIITAPSYVVSKEEEAKLAFTDKSPIADPMHPERPEQLFKMKEAKKKKPVEVPKEEVKTETPAEQPKEEVKAEVKQ